MKARAIVAVTMFAIAGVAAVSGVVSARPSVAADCANWECEGGDMCVENPGGGTFCKRQHNSNLCDTKACAVE